MNKHPLFTILGGKFNYMDPKHTIEFNDAVNSALRDGIKLFIQPYLQDDLALHSHHFFELVYITGGTAHHTLNGSGHFLSKGNYFIVDYGSKHSYEQSKDLSLINCLFLAESIDDTLGKCRSFEDLVHHSLLRYNKLFKLQNSANRIYFDDDGRILSLLEVMQKEQDEQKIGYQEILKNRLLEIIIITMRNIVDYSLKDVKTDIPRYMFDYIHSHYREHKILTAFCGCYHYSPPYISRIFKQETGFTVTEYLQKTRIEKSCELLAGSRMPVPDVAESVGYTDTKSFVALFRKMIGMPPSEYRKRSEP